MDLPTILTLLLVALTTFGCAAPTEDVGATRAASIFGLDDRREYFEARPTEQDHIRGSVVALIELSRIDASDRDDVQIDGFYPADAGVCVEHPYSHQLAAADCSGTLIDDDLVLTAGHCVEAPDFCDSYALVFDFYYTAERRPARITQNSLYGCEEIVDMEWAGTGSNDWAVIRLNVPVDASRHPVPVQRTHFALDGEPVWGAGFSLGTPAKVTKGEVVSSYGGERFYQMRIDTDRGNSGTGILDASGTLVGVMSTVAIHEDRSTCEILQRLSDDEEDWTMLSNATSAHLAVRAICDAGLGSPVLCEAPVAHDVPLDEAVADGPADGADADASLDPMEPAAGGGCSATSADDAGPLTTLALLGLVGLLGRRRERR